MKSDEFENIRTHMGISQKALAKALGCAQKTISRYERGDSKIPDSVEGIMRLMRDSKKISIERSRKSGTSTRRRNLPKVVRQSKLYRPLHIILEIRETGLASSTLTINQ